MTDLTALADRIEALSVSNREMDARIWCAVTGKVFKKAIAHKHPDGRPAFFSFRTNEGDISVMECPQYTASIDAAMTLVLEEWHCGMGRDGNLHSPTACWAWVRFRISEGNWQETPMNFRAKTLAIAITAAALRARALSTMSKGEGNG